MFDAHCHLQFQQFDADRDEAVERARAAGLRGLLIAGYDATRRATAASLMQRPGVWATPGIHPWAVAEMSDPQLEKAIEHLAGDLEDFDWCGLGELGIDHFRVKDKVGRRQQRKAFVEQLGLAREKNLPVVIHAVRCHNTMIGVLRDEGLPEAGGIMHGYSGSPRQVGTFLMMNLDISVGTPMTFESSDRLHEVVRQVPRERLLVETDAPDRPPRGHRGERNELHWLEKVIEEVARVWECKTEVVARVTEANTRRRFALGDEFLRPKTGSGDEK